MTIMKKQYIKPTANSYAGITPPILQDAVSIPVKDKDSNNGEEITDKSEQLSKQHRFSPWETGDE